MINKYYETIKIVKEAGKIFKEQSIDNLVIDIKGLNNFVTNIDYQIQQFLINNLSNLDKTSTFISEEKNNKRINLNNTWVIDPIDGTTNMIHNFKSFAISVAYVYNKETIFGIVYNPLTDELFSAFKGKGAFKNNKQISVSNINNVEDSIVLFDLPNNKYYQGKTFSNALNLSYLCQDVKKIGSASLDICRVASGDFEGYYNFDLKIWDYYAAKLILEEAGGNLLVVEGNKKRTIIVDNDKIGLIKYMSI